MNPFPYRIVVEWSAEDRAYVARVPALAGCASHGATPEAAAREAAGAARAILAVLAEDRTSLPQPDAVGEYSGQLRLRLPRSLHQRLARLAAADGVSLNQELVNLLSSGAGGAPTDPDLRMARDSPAAARVRTRRLPAPRVPSPERRPRS